MNVLKDFFALAAVMVAAAIGGSASAQELSFAFDPKEVVLPSGQYTPAETYSPLVWVFNDGRRYEDRFYNRILAVPPVDGEGREWFAEDYVPTDNEIAWGVQTSPFSSDEYYNNMKAYRWTTVEIMAEFYMRRTFTISEPIVGRLYLACGHDDAPAEWYINGVLVHSVGDGWNNAEVKLLTEEQQALIHTDGTPNVLAVHVHQNWGGAYADCGLYRAKASMVTNLLASLEWGEWPCKYYFLNNNADLALAESAKWASLDEDESYWITGVGPLSNSPDRFRTTFWASGSHPLLVRRHFTLTRDQIAKLSESTLTLRCSYDENPKVYLNGQLIWQANGWNDNDYASMELTARQKATLREGDNVLAVSLMQGEGGGHIDYSLQVISPYEYSGVIGVGTDTATVCGDNRIYNLTGLYVGTDKSRLPSGIYISNGKKFIVK